MGDGKATVRLRAAGHSVAVHLVAREDPPEALTCSSDPAGFPRWEVTRVVG